MRRSDARRCIKFGIDVEIISSTRCRRDLHRMARRLRKKSHMSTAKMRGKISHDVYAALEGFFG